MKRSSEGKCEMIIGTEKERDRKKIARKRRQELRETSELTVVVA